MAIPTDIGRNDPCPCGSGKKYKKCCMSKDETAQHNALEKQWKENEKKAKATADEKAKTEPASAKVQQKPTSQVKEHHHNTFAAPKFNTPRRTGGG